MSILPKHIWADGTGTAKNITLADFDDPAHEELFVGTGPFEYTTGAEGGPYTFQKYADYWWNGSTGMPNMAGAKALPEGDYPKTSTVKITVIEGESNRVLAMKNGEADSERYECSNAAIETVSGAGYENVRVIDAGASRWDYYFAFNMGLKPLDDIVVRRAIAYALDKDAIADAARGDYAVVSDSVLPEGFFPGWHNPNVEKYPYNLAKANQMLDDAGYEDADDDGVRDIPGWEPEESPGFEFLIVMFGMLAAIPLIKKRK
jgi:ABC-type transport system substrate-binding protein